ncbi:hypothetical protein L905_06870 [Agrobacterium sp. TS43]|uniref:hypothetical protein n=1 Tax=Agrobacterium TaxID=357 RepID=UPI000382391F|nr:MULTISPECIES: hypothetical protein [Agrobacterium]EPR21218.1 hypothetical protein L902_01715 [Agrobacterium radiobacter DSM 30147]KDR90531.1 hypothetical protein K538_05145 [Agrobacterium tumefaciens GW4]KVK49869.1 hypothetical protein L903_18525 [Agrobacterium sp. JL28]KVK50161.1 hypothetical protein L904_18525 [Agrobacterium sp. LY4]KVK59203.1 hypothetical protein L905_06870 [Agrobacterium sp. TS43]
MIADQNCNAPYSSGPEHLDSAPSHVNLLAALGIVEVTYRLSGGGDSGECDLEQVVYADGRRGAVLPSIPIGFSDDGTILLLDRVLEDIAENAPEGDWVNNEGGRGTVSFFPTETEVDARLVCDMTYGDEDDEDSDDFTDFFDDIDPPGEDDASEQLNVCGTTEEDVQ